MVTERLKTGSRERARGAGLRWTEHSLGIAVLSFDVDHGRARRASAGAALTAAERRVAALAVAGSTNAEIARELRLATGTVAKQMSSCLKKLGVRSRFELAHLGLP